MKEIKKLGNKKKQDIKKGRKSIKQQEIKKLQETKKSWK